MADKEEWYYLKNFKTKKFFKGFKGNKPIWVVDVADIIPQKEMDALRTQRRLENLYAPMQKVVLVQKV